MILPNFLGIGVPKAGTSTLHYLLRDHPDVFLTPSKEAHYFDRNRDKPMSWYSDTFFSTWSGQTHIGEITPAYFPVLPSIETIAERLGRDMKLIISFRFPVARSFSHYLHFARLLDVAAPFETALPDPEEYYLRSSLYAERMQKVYELFPRENVLVLIFERDIAAGRLETGYRKIADFLGLRDVPMNFDTVSGRAWIPQVQEITETIGAVEDDGREIVLNPGDFTIRTVTSTESGVVTIHERNPTPERSAWLRGIRDDITREIDRATVERLYDRYFRTDVEAFKRIIGDPIPEWDPTSVFLTLGDSGG